MPINDIKSSLSEAVSLSPAARTAAANGTGVDLAGFESAVCIVQFGTWTDGTHTPKLQDSPDNTTFTDVPVGNLQGAFTAVTAGAGSNTSQRIGYTGSQRYLRAVMTVAGATTGALSGALIVRGHPRSLPTP